ncbi:arylesterase [Allochromatium palmeri]|uniref:Arylesterase n=1 Tax=Allochromatium palmeri TaxID=231048 RepID=A0A6N8E9F0_9GAMM|nr:arylesterase [Allochromatium palmeri]MTW20765.1 arylesterase [Allochromatium palmeri]
MRYLLLTLILLCPPLETFAQAPVVLVLGDSLSAGYGIDTGQGWVARLAERIERAGRPYQVVNASVSGETTAGGLTRLPSLLERHRPAVLVIELGANDGLRGWDFDLMRDTLGQLVVQGRESGARVMLIGVRLPPNYGASYVDGFQAVFMEVAAEQGVPLVPALLKDVAEDWSLMQPDGLHPTAEAQERLLDNVWPTLEPLLLD